MLTDLVLNSKVFKSLPVSLDKGLAIKLGLDLPAKWLEKPGSLKLQIKGVGRRAIENPPTKLLSSTDRILLRNNELLHKGFYFPHLEITNLSIRRTSKKNPRQIKIQANKLLPKHLRKLYAYTKLEPACESGPHSSAILFHFPDYIDKLKKKNEDHVAFITENYKKLKNSSLLKFGDHIFLTVKYKNPRLNDIPLCRIHSMIYIAPKLVFSKNNFGTAAPLYLQDFEKIIELLHPVTKNTSTNFEFWRPIN
ncbi:hypothetical protein KKE45_00500 [Patescibacteria group bacterium]|nr:hypothetical protein [Patescibacteria group bacterium]